MMSAILCSAARLPLILAAGTTGNIKVRLISGNDVGSFSSITLKLVCENRFFSPKQENRPSRVTDLITAQRFPAPLQALQAQSLHPQNSC